MNDSAVFGFGIFIGKQTFMGPSRKKFVSFSVKIRRRFDVFLLRKISVEIPDDTILNPIKICLPK